MKIKVIIFLGMLFIFSSISFAMYKCKNSEKYGCPNIVSSKGSICEKCASCIRRCKDASLCFVVGDNRDICRICNRDILRPPEKRPCGGALGRACPTGSFCDLEYRRCEACQAAFVPTQPNPKRAKVY